MVTTSFSLNLRLVECGIKNIIHCGQHDILVGFQSGKLSHAPEHMDLSQCVYRREVRVCTQSRVQKLVAGRVKGDRCHWRG